MAAGRDVRHVLAPLRREAREVFVPAELFYGTAPGAGADPTKGLTGQSPRWRFSATTRQGICAEVRLPRDRVPGTPVRFRFVYSIPTGPGGGHIMWRLDYLVVGNGEDVTSTAAVRTVRAPAPAPGIVVESDPIEIPASELDGKAEPVVLQLGIIRYADDAGDTEASDADLYGLRMEYTAYV